MRREIEEIIEDVRSNLKRPWSDIDYISQTYFALRNNSNFFPKKK